MMRLALSHRGAPGSGTRHCAGGIVCAALRPAHGAYPHMQSEPFSPGTDRELFAFAWVISVSRDAVLCYQPNCVFVYIYMRERDIKCLWRRCAHLKLRMVMEGRVCCEVEVVWQVNSALNWGGVRVAIVTRDVTAGGAQFTCRCLLERAGCASAVQPVCARARVCVCVWGRCSAERAMDLKNVSRHGSAEE